MPLALIDRPKGVSMILVTKTSDQTRQRSTLSLLVQVLLGVCVCVFIKLHITAQSGPAILVILCHHAIRPCHPSHSMPLALIDRPKGVSMILVTKTSDQTRQRSTLSLLVQVLLGVCVCVFIKLHITAQSGPAILVILCHSH